MKANAGPLACLIAVFSLSFLLTGLGRDLGKSSDRKYVADDVMEVFRYFVVIPWQAEETTKKEWAIFDTHGATPGGLFSPEVVIQRFNELPEERKAKGIFILTSVTHLKDVEKAKTEMQPDLLKNYGDADWLKAKRKSVEDLVKACDRAGVSLWVNTNLKLKGELLTFIKLTQN